MRYALIAWIAFASTVCCGEIDVDEVLRWQEIRKNKDRISEVVKERVKAIVAQPERFDLALNHRSFNGDNQYDANYHEWNFTILYKTEPLDRDEVFNEVSLVLETTLSVLEQEGFHPEQDNIRIRCRTNYTESLRGEDVMFSFGKGHISYKPYEDPIQFRERWDRFTDGE